MSDQRVDTAVVARPLSLSEDLCFDPPFVLAPMEGVTHRVFRDLILDIGGPGAAWTEFLRVSNHALKVKAIARELGPPRPDVPVGVQLMGIVPALVAESAVNAVAAGAPTIDLNFGCPAPRVFNKCAGSALLDHPERVEALVKATATSVEVPVTAKIRLGTKDSSLLEEIVGAVEEGGAAALSVHARTRDDGYKHPARWEELARVREWCRLPLIGNGDVLTVSDAYRMLACGVDGVMIGRGALRDPWLFARLKAHHTGTPGPEVTAETVLQFHQRYRDAMLETRGSERSVLGQLKQIYRRLAVGIPLDETSRRQLLRTQTLSELDQLLQALAKTVS